MTLRRLVHCALALTVAFAGLAALYLNLGAEFAGLAQLLVYVGAIVPPAGSSAAKVMVGEDVSKTDPFVVSEEFAKAAFGNDLSEEQWGSHAASLVPDAPGIMNGVISGLPSGIPVTYVNMTDDVPVPPALAEQMAANLGTGVERRTIEAGHTVMVSQPRALADIINAAVASADD